jgi:hypothetical protein
MKNLNKNEANIFLAETGFSIGSWNEIKLNDDLRNKNEVYKFALKREKIFLFSYHVFDLIKNAKWYMLQFDNSTGALSPHENAMFSNLIYGHEKYISINEIESKNFLFEINTKNKKNTAFLIANLICLVLDFELHAYGHFYKSRSIRRGLLV